MAIYENLTIEKGMYKPGGYGLTQTLEKLDPTENYKGTPLGELDAFQRQLKRFDIKVSGPQSDRVEKFFGTTSSAALFPEYVGRAVRQGMETKNVLKDIVATTTHIDGMDYRSIAYVPNDADIALQRVNEGANITEVNITLQDNLVYLRKRGKMLVASYEAIRFQRLDLFTVMLRQIGANIARTLLKDAVNLIINGDNNANPADTYNTETEGSLVYSDLINLWGEISPYNLNTIIAPTHEVKTLLNLTEMKDSFAGHNFHKTGEMITPLGAKLIHDPDMNSGRIIGLDKNYALELVIAGDVSTEYDKLIDRQLERAAITTICGFNKIIVDAARVLEIN